MRTGTSRRPGPPAPPNSVSICPPCSPAPPTTCTGSRATPSVPTSSPASSTRPCASPPCRPITAAAKRTSGNRPWPRPATSISFVRSTTASTSTPSATSWPSAEQPVLDPLLPPDARENARSVRTALTSEMWEAINEAYLHLRSFEGRDMDPGGVRPLPRLGEGRVARLRRLGLPHDAAQRRLLVHPDRHRHRARRQHRPHPRREVPRASARDRAGRRQPPTTSSGPRSCARSRR